MVRSEEAEAWFAAVYEAVQEIPRGKVTSYGHIATLLDCPERPRQVGVSLKHLPSSERSDLAFHEGNVPWQRVINAKGIISPRASGASRQAAALRREGVEVGRGSLGEFTVDFSRYGWFPSVLPSEAAEEASSSEGEDGDDQGDRGLEGRDTQDSQIARDSALANPRGGGDGRGGRRTRSRREGHRQ
ncbi:DNA binding methylated-DNA--cysteine S-methyltransferase [Xylona heveae TC161]|uniref:DNA binding methylated-DNA--cysteine S-methyltransferase n=1 Tax=Xylona heveae (strain CBS 132557 / TC161) TaxID=1328760 RepID=A0A165FPM1_XYLHT|nr:DNA binding methylated-DNA--cysteine S-methyltransferase [Xylona heveae TC161]KZF21231.1 DNA binding methylated-DNA--cysteine S-methyltransferase [Xylona heveae TC161]